MPAGGFVEISMIVFVSSVSILVSSVSILVNSVSFLGAMSGNVCTFAASSETEVGT